MKTNFKTVRVNLQLACNYIEAVEDETKEVNK